mgnify:CR=1 FL=1
MKKYLLWISIPLLAFSLLSACKKKKGDNKSDENNTTVEDFMSTKLGSFWYYKSNEGAVNFVEATGKDSMVQGAKYDYYTAKDTNANYWITATYYAKNGNNYINLVDLDGSQTNYVPVIIFVDSAKVGDNWTNTHTMKYSGNNVDLQIEGEVIAVGATETIEGKTYTNVTKVKSKLKGRSIPLVPAFINCGYAEMWFQKGVGVLKKDIDLDILIFYKRKYQEWIIDYHIEP